MLNRAVLFFKYRLHNPNLSLVDLYILKPVWIDEKGIEIKNTGGSGITGTRLPSLGRFGVESLSRHDDTDLKNALQNKISPDLIEQLLSDAQSAAFQKNLRRAILETAIACEIAVKQTFFAKATPSVAAYEFLEDHGKVRVTVLDLIISVAKQAFGKSFKEDKESHYDNIDFLFRCRNKVAHRGELIYKDQSGILYSVDDDKLADWWESVEILRAWLQARAKELAATEPTSKCV